MTEQLAEGQAREANAHAAHAAGGGGYGGGGYGGGGYGGGVAVGRPSASGDLLDLAGRYEERGAELELLKVEKRRLQQLVDDMKRGNTEGIYQQARGRRV